MLRDSYLKFAALVLLAPLVLLLQACPGTTSAYRAADTLEETAFVVTEHYYSVLREANRLADEGAPQEWIEEVAAKERELTPRIIQLRDYVQAYEDVRSAENEQQLSEALSESVVLVSEFIDLVSEEE